MNREEREKWFADNQWYLDAIREKREIEMQVFDGDSWVRDIPSGFDLHEEDEIYRALRCTYYAARPIPPKQRRYLGPVDMMRWFFEHGWKVDNYGHWRAPLNSGGVTSFTPEMWQYCGGKELPHTGYIWHPDWIEEVYELWRLK